MSEREDEDGGVTPAEVAVTTRVRVFPSTDKEAHGVIVEDFGEGFTPNEEIAKVKF